MAHCKLSVNINKIATLRNSRGGNVPNLLQCTLDLIDLGAEGITVHPRPDERHIRKKDVYDLKRILKKVNLKRPHHKKIEFNIEGYPSPAFLKMIQKIRPDQVTLVPDPPHVITSNAGWKVHQNRNFLYKVTRQIHNCGARVSLFVDPYHFSKKDLVALAASNADRIELYTEKYAKDYVTKKKRSTVSRYKKVATLAAIHGVQVNAGHDLSTQNLLYLLQQIPQILEVSIGHALISESLYLGFEKTLSNYLREIRRARRATHSSQR